MAKKKKNEDVVEETVKDTAKSPKKVSNKSTIKAKQNLFAPGGEFIAQGTEIEVGGAELDALLASGKWQVIK